MTTQGRIRWQQKLVRAIRKTGTIEKALVEIKAEDWQRESVQKWLTEDVLFKDSALHAQEKAWLMALRSTGQTMKACEIVGVGIVEVFDWAHNDKVFAGDWTALVQKLESANRIRISDLVEPAIKVKKKILDKGNTENADLDELRLANQASDQVLKGSGYLKDSPTVAVDNSKTQYNIVVNSSEGEKKLQRLLEGERTGKEMPGGNG